MIKEQLIEEMQAIEEPRPLDVKVRMQTEAGPVMGVITRVGTDEDGQALVDVTPLPPPPGEHEEIEA